METNLYTAPLLEQSRMDIIFVLTDALFLIIRVEADSQPHSDFQISDLCNVIIFGINYGNLGRVIMLTVFQKFETVSNSVLFFVGKWGLLCSGFTSSIEELNMAHSLVFEFL